MEQLRTRPLVTEFKDYRLFLKALFVWSKENKRSFSFEFCAKKLGTSKSYLKQVLDQKIHVDLNRATSIAKLFGLNAFEKQYFFVLIIQNEIRDQDLKNHFSLVLERLKANEQVEGLKAYRTRTKNGEGVQLEDWLSLTIGALTHFPDFQPDVRWLRKKLGDSVSEKDIENIFEKMKQSRMICVKDGRYREALSHHSPDPFEVDPQKRYIYGALKTLDILSGDFEKHRPGLFFNGALALDATDYEKVMDIYYKFIQELVALSEGAKSPERVIFMSSNIFHVVK